jgi:hypothetical protein
MPTALQDVINPIVATHLFFTTYLGSGVTVTQKRTLATKLLLYEIKGRPVDTGTARLDRFSDEWDQWKIRPQLVTATDRMKQTLSRFGAPWAPGEVVLSNLRAFPGAYWGLRWVSGVLWPDARNIMRAFYNQSSPVSLPLAERNRYSALRLRYNSGDAALDRAQLFMNYFLPDRPPGLPGEALVSPATF